MAKLTLSPLSSLQNETTAIATINANMELIEDAIENTLSRDGTVPNTMTSEFDANSQRIINLPAPVDDNDAARLVDVGDAPTYAQEASDSADAAAASATAAASSASSASSSASSASSSASAASTSATAAAASATTSANNATVVVGNEYSFATSTSMADPGTGLFRFNNATVASATAIAISALTNASGNPNIRTEIASWDDSTNTNRGTIYIRKIGTPATFAAFTVSGALTDNTTWLQLAVTYVTGNGSFSASDRLSVQFVRAGDKGADGTVAGPGVSVDNEIALWNGTTGATLKRASSSGILKATSGVIGTVSSSDNLSIGTITSTTSSANALAVGPNGTTNPVLQVDNSTASAATGIKITGAAAAAGIAVAAISSGTNENLTVNAKGSGSVSIGSSSTGGVALAAGGGNVSVTGSLTTTGVIELGNASDTTLSRNAAGQLAIEAGGGSLYTGTIELGNASDTTISRVSAGIIAVEGQTVPMLNTANPFTAHQYFPLATITDGANLSWTVSTGQKGKVTLGGNRTMNAVTGAVEGATYTLWVIQDGTGSRTITWTTSGAGSFDFGTAGAPTLTTTASKADLLTFEAISIGGTLKLRFSGITRGFA